MDIWKLLQYITTWDIITLCFRHYSNKHQEGELVDVVGNIRSYSKKVSENKNKVNIYVFTYFDVPKYEDGIETNNSVLIDGRICKMGEPIYHKNGSVSRSFILANNIFISNNKGKINNYIPVVCWDNNVELLNNFSVNSKLKVQGKIHSRTYKKYSNDNLEIKTAHELVAENIEVL
jgi:hypothetical protein